MSFNLDMYTSTENYVKQRTGKSFSKLKKPLSLYNCILRQAKLNLTTNPIQDAFQNEVANYPKHVFHKNAVIGNRYPVQFVCFKLKLVVILNDRCDKRCKDLLHKLGFTIKLVNVSNVADVKLYVNSLMMQK